MDLSKIIGQTPQSPEEADKIMTEAGLPELPSEIAQTVSEMSESEVLGFILAQLSTEMRSLLQMVRRMRERCAGCATLGQNCPACAADGTVAAGVLANLILITRVANSAMRPNTRFTASREAAREAKGK